MCTRYRTYDNTTTSQDRIAYNSGVNLNRVRRTPLRATHVTNTPLAFHSVRRRVCEEEHALIAHLGGTKNVSLRVLTRLAHATRGREDLEYETPAASFSRTSRTTREPSRVPRPSGMRLSSATGQCTLTSVPLYCSARPERRRWTQRWRPPSGLWQTRRPGSRRDLHRLGLRPCHPATAWPTATTITTAWPNARARCHRR